jgi:hypothetical protein
MGFSGDSLALPSASANEFCCRSGQSHQAVNRLMIFPGQANLPIGVPEFQPRRQASHTIRNALFWVRQEMPHEATRCPSPLG